MAWQGTSAGISHTLTDTHTHNTTRLDKDRLQLILSGEEVGYVYCVKAGNINSAVHTKTNTESIQRQGW